MANPCRVEFIILGNNESMFPISIVYQYSGGTGRWNILLWRERKRLFRIFDTMVAEEWTKHT